MPIAGTKYDCRLRIDPQRHEEIKALRYNGLSYGKIAKQFGVSAQLIYSICNPKPRKPQQYNKAKQAQYTQRHRQYIGMLKGSGLIHVTPR